MRKLVLIVFVIFLVLPVTGQIPYNIPFSPRPAVGCPTGSEICDAFDEDTMGSTWINEQGTFTIGSGQLTADTGATLKNVRYDADTLDNTTYQVACVEISAYDASSSHAGAYLRGNSASTGPAWGMYVRNDSGLMQTAEFEDKTTTDVDHCNSSTGLTDPEIGDVFCFEYDESGGANGDAVLSYWLNPNSCTIETDCASSWDSAHTNWGTPSTPSGWTENADDADCTDSDANWPDGSNVGSSGFAGYSITYFVAWSSAS